jgi:hypothetical protein
MLRLKAEREAAQRAEEEAFRQSMMAKFAEDDRLEQLNAQKRRLKVRGACCCRNIAYDCFCMVWPCSNQFKKQSVRSERLFWWCGVVSEKKQGSWQAASIWP